MGKTITNIECFQTATEVQIAHPRVISSRPARFGVNLTNVVFLFGGQRDRDFLLYRWMFQKHDTKVSNKHPSISKLRLSEQIPPKMLRRAQENS